MKFISTLILVLNAIVLQAQDFNKAKLDSLFTLIETNNKGWGSASIFKDGKEIYTRSIGYANLEDSIPATKETKYQIGSISKTFTAVIVMKLIEEGKLSLDTKLSKFFPEISNAEEITIEQLLKHRSGIFNYTNSKNFSTYYLKNTSKDFLLNEIKNLGVVFKPNEKFEYSNSNYILLTWIIEDITKKEYKMVLNDYIEKPLELKNTYFKTIATKKENEAKSYINSLKTEVVPDWNTSVALGAGGITSTPTDLNIFITKLFDGKLVSKKSLALMMPSDNYYGLGIFKVPFNNKTGYGHNGKIAGFDSVVYNFNLDNVSISYLSNNTDFIVNDIVIGMLSIYFDNKYKFPTFSIYKVSLETLKEYVGVYSKENFPIKITITNEGNKLLGQGTNQPQFILEPVEKHKFKVDAVGAKIEFKPESKQLILHQGGQVIEMIKE